MGNYKNLEIEFIERTLNLIAQYESIQYKFDFNNQYNYTLLINCMLGLIVLPKERTISYLPTNFLDNELKTQMGLINSTVNDNYTTLKKLIIALRHSISHFNIKVVSDLDEIQTIDQIIFEVDDHNSKVQVANFRANELLPFTRYYATWLLSNLKNYNNK